MYNNTIMSQLIRSLSMHVTKLCMYRLLYFHTESLPVNSKNFRIGRLV